MTCVRKTEKKEEEQIQYSEKGSLTKSFFFLLNEKKKNKSKIASSEP